MRNVYKGFQTAKMAVPKLHVASINKAFDTHHAPGLKRPALRLEKGQTTKRVHMPGKNPGIIK